jgi:hypothetical protein
LGHLHRFVGLKHTQHRSVGADDSDFRDANAVIDSNLESALLLARVEAGAAH